MTKLEKMQRIFEIKDELFRLSQEDSVTIESAKLVEESTKLTIDIIDGIYDPSEIIGLDDLTNEQQNHIMNVNKTHTQCNGTDRQAGMKIIKAWVDERNTTCVKLLNGEWYHYYDDGTWG